jgi:GTP-binding protein HflX
LFNRITGAQAHAADQLFVTLDPTMRRVGLPGGGEAVLSDTVGFIRDLPHTLVQAFHSTLEEVTQASMLLHVVDVNNLENDQHIEQVNNVLTEIGAAELPVIMVYNKIDLGSTPCRVERDARGLPSKVWTSAATGAGVSALVHALREVIQTENHSCTLRIPPHAGAVRAFLYRHARVVRDTTADGGGWMIEAEISTPELGRLYQQEGIGNCHVNEGSGWY